MDSASVLEYIDKNQVLTFELMDLSMLLNIFHSQVPPIDQKRIVAFVNHFVVSSVTFLNKFAVNCETKFIDFESKLHKVEASLSILESKASTILFLCLILSMFVNLTFVYYIAALIDPRTRERCRASQQ